MMLLWVMSLLFYLVWAVTQLESVLAFEIQSQAIQVSHQSEFETVEALLVQCEDRLRTLFIHEPDLTSEQFDSFEIAGCRVKLINKLGMANQKNYQTKNVRLIEIEAGQRIRLRSVLRYQITSQQINRINWQPIDE